MREAAEKAIEYTAGRDRSILDTDEMRALAVVRLVEIIGEAARAISEPTRTQCPAWKSRFQPDVELPVQ
jgi:uncharacterized protein with HEPN domain